MRGQIYYILGDDEIHTRGVSHMVPRSNLGLPNIPPISDVKVTGLVMEKLHPTLGSLMVLYREVKYY